MLDHKSYIESVIKLPNGATIQMWAKNIQQCGQNSVTEQEIIPGASFNASGALSV